MKRINDCLDDLSTETVRRWFRKMRLYEDAYRGGASSETILKEVAKLKKRKKSHR